jgi:predicted alpha/beta-hydrolase family hydrolase
VAEGSGVVFVGFEVTVAPGLAIGARHYAANPESSRHTVLILAHGAGAGQASPFMAGYATGLSRRGLDVVTFDFPYMRARRRIPDTNARLEATWRAVLGAVTSERRLVAAEQSVAGPSGVERGLSAVEQGVAGPSGVGRGPSAVEQGFSPALRPGQQGRLFIGGKSMGGRIASQVAASPDAGPAPIAGLVFLGYPLHPPGRPEQRRDRHLPAIAQPMFFVQGERDPFGSAEEIRALVAGLPRAELHVVAGAGHSLEPPGRGRAGAPHDALQDLIVEWIARRS